jgi:hypothetical protein
MRVAMKRRRRLRGLCLVAIVALLGSIDTSARAVKPMFARECNAIDLSPLYATDHTVFCGRTLGSNGINQIVISRSTDAGRSWAEKTYSVTTTEAQPQIHAFIFPDSYATTHRMFIQSGQSILGPSPLDPATLIVYAPYGGAGSQDPDLTPIASTSPLGSTFLLAQQNESYRADLPGLTAVTGTSPAYTTRFLARPTDTYAPYAIGVTGNYNGHVGVVETGLYSCLPNATCAVELHSVPGRSYVASFLGPKTAAGDTIVMQTDGASPDDVNHPSPLITITQDGGKTMTTWAGLTNALRPVINDSVQRRTALHPLGIAWDPRNPKRIIVRASDDEVVAIVRSDDGSKSFRTIATQKTVPWRNNRALTSPSSTSTRLMLTPDGRLFTLGGDHGTLLASSALYCSKDLGVHWSLSC